MCKWPSTTPTLVMRDIHKWLLDSNVWEKIENKKVLVVCVAA